MLWRKVMEYIGEQDDIMPSGNGIVEEISCHNLYRLLKGCVDHPLAGERSHRGYFEQGRFQPWVMAQDSEQKRPGPATQIQHAVMVTKIVARCQRLRRRCGLRFDALIHNLAQRFIQGLKRRLLRAHGLFQVRPGRITEAVPEAQ